MITLLTNLTAANQADVDSLKIILKKLVKSTPKEIGCIAYSIYREVNNPLSFHMLESWNTQEDIERHEKLLLESGILERASKLLDRDLNNIKIEKI